MAYNVVIKRQVAARNIDALNRSFRADVDIENGNIMLLDTRSDVDGEDEVFVASKPAADSLGVWMAKSSEVVVSDLGTVKARNLIVDPRAFTNVAGLIGSAFCPQKKDIIEMTNGDAENDYMIADADYALVGAAAAGTGFAMKKIGTSILHIGNGALNKTPVTTYIYEVVNN